MYTITDGEFSGMMSGETFDTLQDVINRLADYHDNDWSGVNDSDEPITIYETLDVMEDDMERITFLCEHGTWDVLLNGVSIFD